MNVFYHSFKVSSKVGMGHLLADEAVKFRKQAVQTGCDVQPHGGVAGAGDDKKCGEIKEIRIFMANRKS